MNDNIPQDLNFLEKKPPKIIMFTGKGGVGKTTSSSAVAVHFALKGLQTLLISTDPSPSLSDMFETNVKGNITPIEGVPNLGVVELDYDEVIERWKERYGDEVYDVASAFLPVEREIIDYIAGVPGMDQEYALGYLFELYISGDYDVIVWDTAPAGGTLNLLKIQDTFYQHLGDAAKMYMKVRQAIETLRVGRNKKDPLKLIALWEELSKNVLKMMKSDNTLGFVVTNPEALCVSQAKRIVADFEKFGIDVGGIVLNKVLTEEAADSAFNKSRIAVQRKYIDEIDEAYKGEMPIVQIPVMSYEVKGVDAMVKISDVLFPPNPAQPSI
jgi:arsenite-transporting ATPase